MPPLRQENQPTLATVPLRDDRMWSCLICGSSGFRTRPSHGCPRCGHSKVSIVTAEYRFLSRRSIAAMAEGVPMVGV